MQNSIYDEFEDAINRFLVDHPEAEFGPAHVLFSDLNIDISYINGCLADLANILSEKYNQLNNSDKLNAELIFEIDSLAKQVIFLLYWKSYIMKCESYD